MKILVHRLYTHPMYAKAIQFGRLITITGSAQLLIQGMGFLSGILIIRFLSKQEYAWYTLANTMLGTMTMLADSGIANGVMAEAGQHWQDKRKLGAVMATGLRLRRKFGILSLLFTVPVLAYLLLDHGAGRLTASLIILSLVPAFFAALSDSLLEITPKLHQDIKALQRNQIEVSVGRLALNTSLLFFFPFTFIAISAASLPRIYGNYKLRMISAPYAGTGESEDPHIEKRVMRSVKRTLPVVIYYSISGQLSIWLISFFGSTTSISHLGALGRLAIIFNLILILFSVLIVPRFSRLSTSKQLLLKRYLFMQLGTFLISALLLLMIWLFSNQILWVLGKEYYGLNYELFLVGLSSCASLMVGVCSQLVLSRGWFLNPYIIIGIHFISTIFSLKFFNISSLIGVLYFNTIVSFLYYLVIFVYGMLSIGKIRLEQ